MSNEMKGNLAIAAFVALFLCIIALIVLLARVLEQLWMRRVSCRYRVAKERRMHLLADADWLGQAIGAPGGAFHCERALQRKIKKRVDIEESLQLLTKQILTHMGLSPHAVKLYIVHSVFDTHQTAGSRVGSYSRATPERREIELFLKKDQSFWNIAAILAHECAHLFLDVHNLWTRPGSDPEEITDLAAVYLGFGEHLLKGYGQMIKRDRNRVLTTKLGYLQTPEIALLWAHVRRGESLDRAELARREGQRREKEREAAHARQVKQQWEAAA